MMDIFWNGKDEAQRDDLQAHIPMSGEITEENRPKLEEWRKFSNAYYRYYNDGDAFWNKLRHMAKRYGMPKFNGRMDVDLEELGNRVLAAAWNEHKELSNDE